MEPPNLPLTDSEVGFCSPPIHPRNCNDSDCAWIEQAAFDRVTEAQILLGLLCEGGLIKPFFRDFQLAKSWYLTAAAADYPHAMYHLYRINRRGAVIGDFCTDVTRQGLITAANAGQA